MVKRIDALVKSNGFQGAVLALIMAAAVVVGLETSPALMERYGGLILTMDWIILGGFIVEALLKMAAHGKHWHRYFRDPWNLFDFTIIVVCLLPLDGHFAAVLRLARVLRALRLVSVVPKLQLLVAALLKSIPSMLWVGLLLGLLFYIYAVMGVALFRPNDPVHFRDLPTSLLTLFRVVTLEDWTDVMYTQMLGSDRDPTYVNTTDLAVTPRAHPVLGVVYFVSFVMLGTMIMLNLFIGVIISSMNEAQAEAERQLRERHVAESGRATVGDELASLERELDAIKGRVHLLRKRDQME